MHLFFYFLKWAYIEPNAIQNELQHRSDALNTFSKQAPLMH